ncbi:MAG: DUF4390 domain-containing protein [Rubrivivax sp.]|nr:DUF4390 domain-containing protein [Rubrivivax sp.]
MLQGLLLVLALWASAVDSLRAQGVELATLKAARHEGRLELEFATRITLPKAVEDALQRGVPVYFAARAEVYRSRWYWRDERVVRASRSWRVAYQPLTGSWRVGTGGLHQSFNSLDEALAVISRSTGWALTELAQLDADSRHYVEFSYRLDTSQLPSPMQIGFGGQGDWAIGVERTLRLD